MEEQNKENQTEQKESKFKIEYESEKAFSILVNNMNLLKVLARCVDCVVKMHTTLSSMDEELGIQFKNIIQQQEWIWSFIEQRDNEKAQVPND